MEEAILNIELGDPSCSRSSSWGETWESSCREKVPLTFPWRLKAEDLLPQAAPMFILRGFLYLKKHSALTTTWKDLGGVLLNEVSPTERDKYWMILMILTSMWSLKRKRKKRKKKSQKQIQTLRKEIRYVVIRGRW